jgi:hypothetical protein
MISKEKKLIYISVIILSIFFFNNAFIPTISFVVGILIAVTIIYYDFQISKTTVDDLNTQLHYKLASLLKEENLKQPEYLHLEPDMINLFYDIRDFRVYNRDAYVKSIRSVDSLLRIKKEIENGYKYTIIPKLSPWQNFGYTNKATVLSNITNYRSLFEAAETLSTNAVNHIHSFVISLPPEEIYRTKHKRALDKFHILSKRIVDDILITCKFFTTDPMLGQDYGLPKPDKPNKQEPFEFITI